ncbi:hypothetical protein K4A83_12905 [Spirulina subsalsa FACHB-351]|uniref:Right handed beta helix domain-containing protein n=1 Tax=Spirulina subsalsa FACHB-351 TaxID=234711 RepID=A0ABT3L6N0_9CYAN|nr:right-handed parallel beta-helix repeat-containing protein [Spirulina subsalsa]MCW6037162.1 hypothetical protein [Spirulina subsalsa FACHB-351]
MKRILSLCCSSFVLLAGLTSPSSAQEELNPSPLSTEAQDLLIAPRIGGGVQSSGGGTPRFTQIETFLPLVQTPGESLLFLEGRVLWLDYETLGTNLLLGQRFYEEKRDLLLGGYVAFDTRDTGNANFKQLGLGFERLSSTWDLRLNGYFPLGTSRQQTAEIISGNGQTQVTDFGFQGNYLLLSGQRSFNTLRTFESAMLALDGEVGGKIADLGSFGELRGYGGLYYYNAPQNTVLGWRTRLEATADNSQYRVGVTLQDDQRFGTNLIVNFGMNFGGKLTRNPGSPVSTWDRLGYFTARNSTILVVPTMEEFTTVEGFADEKAINPVTGEPWFFHHVNNTGVAGGDGTIENPFGLVGNLNVSGTAIFGANTNNIDNRNEIVYVQLGNNPGIPSFTIPDQVQVLSTAPLQTVPTQRGTVKLPLSDSGLANRPQIVDTVKLGTNSVISGFQITGVQDGGIVGENVGGAQVRDNVITSATHPALRLQNTTGTMEFLRNEIIGNNQGAIQGQQVENLSISGGSITSRNAPGDGIRLDQVRGTVTVDNSPITVSNATGAGMKLSNVTGGVNLTGSSGNRIEGSATTGLQVESSTGAIALSNFNLTHSGSNAAIVADTVSNLQFTNTTVNATGQGAFRGNNLQNLTFAGGSLTSANSANNGLVLSNVTGEVKLSNTPISVSNSREDGIRLDQVRGTVTVDNSPITVSNAAGAGMKLSNVTGGVNLTGSSGNRIEGSATTGLQVESSTGAIALSNFNLTHSGSNAAIVADTVSNLQFTNTTVNATGQGAFRGNNLQNLTFAGGSLTSANSANNGLALDNVTGGVNFSNTTFNLTNSQQNGISLNNIAGTVNISAGEGSQISNTTNSGIKIQNSSGTIALSNFQITETGGTASADGGIFGRNLTNATITISNNTLTNVRHQGIAFTESTGAFNITNNTISNTQFFDDFIGQGVGFYNVNGTVNITGNTITNSTGTGDSAFTPPNITTASGQAIAVANERGDIQLNIENNTVRDSYDDAILVILGRTNPNVAGNPGNATGTLTIRNNQVIDNGAILPGTERGDGLVIGVFEDAVAENITIQGNTFRNNAAGGIDIGAGLNVGSTAEIRNLLIDNNVIVGSETEGIRLSFLASSVGNLTISNNEIADHENIGIVIAAFGIPLMGGDPSMTTGNARFTANITNNITTMTGLNTSISIGTNSNQNSCVRLEGNNSTTQYVFFTTGGTGQLSIVNRDTLSALNTIGILPVQFLPNPPGAAAFGNVTACP